MNAIISLKKHNFQTRDFPCHSKSYLKALFLAMLIGILQVGASRIPEKQNTELPKHEDQQSNEHPNDQSLNAADKSERLQDDRRESQVISRLPKAPKANDAKNTTQKWLDWFEAIGPKTWSNWLLALLAGFAAIIAARTLRANVRSAKAAATNAETLIRLNSPYLGFYNVALKFSMPDRPDYPHVSYFIRNYSQGRALDIEIAHKLQWDVLAATPNYPNSTEYSFAGMNLGYMEELPNIPVPFEEGINSQGIRDALSTQKPLFLYGYVRCADTLGRRHTWGFAYKTTDGTSFKKAGGDTYNYHREHSP